MAKAALIIVDVQNDFCPGGALPVPDGDKVVPVLNIMIEIAKKEGWLIVASRDWHPRKTNHFAEFGGQWPVHCVQETKGAEFHPDLNLPADAIIISKGMRQDEDAYSAFQGFYLLTTANETLEIPLHDLLQQQGVKKLYVGGLCVKATVLDARRLGYAVAVLVDACWAVNINEEDEKNAWGEICRAGARVYSGIVEEIGLN